MLLAPRRTKFRKYRKLRIKNINFSKGGCNLQFGRYGIRTLKSVRLKPEQIEAARRMISRRIKKKAKVWIRAFPDIPISQKPKEVRMGKGKGAVEYWVNRLEAGKILFEVANVTESIAREVFIAAGKKLPVPTIFVKR